VTVLPTDPRQSRCKTSGTTNTLRKRDRRVPPRLSYTAVDEETGEDVEVIEAVECRRCVNTDCKYRQEAMISCVR
jgi:hypothetical protein